MHVLLMDIECRYYCWIYYYVTLQRDDDLIVIEKRNFFSLFCLDLEAQLVHINLAQLTEIFEQLVSAQVKGHVDVSLHDAVSCTLDS